MSNFRAHIMQQADIIAGRLGLPPPVELDFTGIGVRWFAFKEPDGGIAAEYLNGEGVDEVNLYASSENFNQEVFALKNLNNKEHSLRIVYDRKGDTEHRWFGTINIDMLTIIKADGRMIDYSADLEKLKYQPYKYEHVEHPKGKGSGVEEPLRMLSEDNCFLVLAHRNSRLETKGEYKRTQLWTSAGYTYEEMDILFGNEEEGIPSLSHPRSQTWTLRLKTTSSP